MTRILAAIDGTDVSADVLRVGQDAAAMLGDELEAVHVGHDPAARRVAQAQGVPLHELEGAVPEALRTAAAGPDVDLLVVGSRGTGGAPGPPGHVAEDLMTSLAGALLVVPPNHRRTRPLRRMVVALDGTPEAAAALEPVIAGALARGLDVVVVHVLHPAEAPAFVDQPHHWTEAFCQEFRVRNAPQVAARVELRAGDPPDRLLDAAKELDGDLLALAWSQILAPGRAAVVRRAIEAGDLPVLLVPTGP